MYYMFVLIRIFVIIFEYIYKLEQPKKILPGRDLDTGTLMVSLICH